MFKIYIFEIDISYIIETNIKFEEKIIKNNARITQIIGYQILCNITRPRVYTHSIYDLILIYPLSQWF